MLWQKVCALPKIAKSTNKYDENLVRHRRQLFGKFFYLWLSEIPYLPYTTSVVPTEKRLRNTVVFNVKLICSKNWILLAIDNLWERFGRRNGNWFPLLNTKYKLGFDLQLPSSFQLLNISIHENRIRGGTYLKEKVRDFFFYPPSSGITPCVGTVGMVLWGLHLTRPCSFTSFFTVDFRRGNTLKI